MYPQVVKVGVLCRNMYCRRSEEHGLLYVGGGG